MGKVFTEMSPWTAFTCYTVMKKAFKTKNIKSESFENFMMKILNFRSDLKKYEEIIMMIILKYLLLYIWSKMLSLSEDVFSKLSKTKSMQKMFPALQYVLTIVGLLIL